jgi:hypothetical protein
VRAFEVFENTVVVIRLTKGVTDEDSHRVLLIDGTGHWTAPWDLFRVHGY